MVVEVTRMKDEVESVDELSVCLELTYNLHISSLNSFMIVDPR